MAYESQIRELAKGAIGRHGKLEEVVFLRKNEDSILVFADGTALPVHYRAYGYDIRREQYAFPVAVQLGGTDPFSLLTFGYSGTGPACYAAFLRAAGFANTDVSGIDGPLRLNAAGERVPGVRRRAQWIQEFSAPTLAEAREKIGPVPDGSCVLREEVVSDGGEATKTVLVDAASDDEAGRRARAELSPGSQVLGIEVTDRKESAVEKVTAFTEAEALEKARGLVGSSEAAYKKLAKVTPLQKASQGILGLGRKAGVWEARFDLAKKEAKVRFVAPARIKVHFGPRKMLCNRCGKAMSATSEGVYVVGGSPAAKPTLLKLRCEACDITRFEQRQEIEGESIAWQDGKTMPLPA